MLRTESFELVIIDFGLAQTVSPPGGIQSVGMPPGTQTHWSPEKAYGEEYSFPAEVR